MTDLEMRDLLKHYMLAGQTHSDALLDIESKMVFSAEPLILPTAEMEKGLLKKLNGKFVAKTGLKWLFSGIAIASAVTYLALNSTSKPAGLAQVADRPMEKVVPDAQLQNKVQLPGTITLPQREKQGINGDLFFPLLVERDSSIASIPTTAMPLVSILTPASTADERASGEIQNRSNEKQTLKVDTLFKNITRIEIDMLLSNVKLQAIPSQHEGTVSVKGELAIKSKGIVTHRSDYRMYYEREGGTLKVKMLNNGKNNVLYAGSLSYEGNFYFEVPVKTDVVIHSSQGNIDVSGIAAGVCELHAAYGNIVAENIVGPVQLKSSAGDIKVQKVKGSVEARSAYGKQVFTQIEGELAAKSSSGDITAENISGITAITASYGNIITKDIRNELTVVNASGNITCLDIAGTSCNITAGYGTVNLSDIVAETRVHSGSGDMTLNRITGQLDLRSSYGNQVLGNIKGDVVSHSSSGNITIKGCEGNITLELTYGNVILSACKGDIKVVSTSGNITGNQVELLERMDIKSNDGTVRMNISNAMDDLSFDLKSSYGHIHIDKGGVKKQRENGDLMIEKGRIWINSSTMSGDQWFN